MDRTKTITLTANGVERSFEVSLAERLMRMKNNGGWGLPKTSKYEFTKENGFTAKRNKREDTGQKEGGDAGKSD